MVATNSTMRPLGSAAADFSLPNVLADGALVTRQQFVDKPLLIMFICNHCPYVIHLIEPLVAMANDFQSQGFAVLAISSNDATHYPQDGPVPMQSFAREHDFEFPYCYDESQAVARAYGAECTPDFFVFDAAHTLQYRGQMDSARPGNGVAVSGADLAAAMGSILLGEPVDDNQRPSIGCNIKWKAQA